MARKAQLPTQPGEELSHHVPQRDEPGAGPTRQPEHSRTKRGPHGLSSLATGLLRPPQQGRSDNLGDFSSGQGPPRNLFSAFGNPHQARQRQCTPGLSHGCNEGALVRSTLSRTSQRGEVLFSGPPGHHLGEEPLPFISRKPSGYPGAYTRDISNESGLLLPAQVGNISQEALDIMCDIPLSQIDQFDVNVAAQLSEDEAGSRQASQPFERPQKASTKPFFPGALQTIVESNLPVDSSDSSFPGQSLGRPLTPPRSRSAIPVSTPKAFQPYRRANSQQPGGHAHVLEDANSTIIGITGMRPESPREDRSASPAVFEPGNPATKQGHLTHDESQILQAAVTQAHTTLKAAVESIGCPLDLAINRLNSTMATTTRLEMRRTGFYLYTAYFHTAPYDEAKRLGIEYTSAIQTSEEMFQNFKDAFGINWNEYLVTHCNSNPSNDKTIAERKHTHEQLLRQLRSQFEAAEEDYGFQFFLVSTGSNVNEDQSIGASYASEYLQGFSDKRLKMSEDDLIGHAKTHSYDIVSEKRAEMAAAERKAEASCKDDDVIYNAINPENVRQLESDRSSSIQVPASTSLKAFGTNARQHTHANDSKPAASSSRPQPLGVRAKPEPPAPFTTGLASTVGLSDAQIRAVVAALGNPELSKLASELLSVSVQEFSGRGMAVGPAREFVKDYVQLSFALLGLDYAKETYFDWLGFAGKVANNGLILIGWAPGAPFPGEVPPGRTSLGIRALLTAPARKVAKGLRSGTTGFKLCSAEEAAAVIANEMAVFYEAAPPAQSACLQGRRYFANGTSDYLGLYREVRTESQKKPKPLKRNMGNLGGKGKGTGKGRSLTILSESDEDEEHDDNDRDDSGDDDDDASDDDDDDDDKPLGIAPSKLASVSRSTSSDDTERINGGNKRVEYMDDDTDDIFSPQTSDKHPSPRKRANGDPENWSSDDPIMSSPSPKWSRPGASNASSDCSSTTVMGASSAASTGPPKAAAPVPSTPSSIEGAQTFSVPAPLSAPSIPTSDSYVANLPSVPRVGALGVPGVPGVSIGVPRGVRSGLGVPPPGTMLLNLKRKAAYEPVQSTEHSSTRRDNQDARSTRPRTEATSTSFCVTGVPISRIRGESLPPTAQDFAVNVSGYSAAARPPSTTAALAENAVPSGLNSARTASHVSNTVHPAQFSRGSVSTSSWAPLTVDWMHIQQQQQLYQQPFLPRQSSPPQQFAQAPPQFLPAPGQPPQAPYSAQPPPRYAQPQQQYARSAHANEQYVQLSHQPLAYQHQRQRRQPQQRDGYHDYSQPHVQTHEGGGHCANAPSNGADARISKWK